jgi:hypothetical protein
MAFSDRAALCGLEAGDNVTDLKSTILRVKSNFSDLTNRTQSSQPMVQSLGGVGSILPNAFSGL